MMTFVGRVMLVAIVLGFGLASGVVLAGDPVPGIDISLEQIPGGVVDAGATDTGYYLRADARNLNEIAAALLRERSCDKDKRCAEFVARLSDIADQLDELAKGTDARKLNLVPSWVMKARKHDAAMATIQNTR